MYLSIYSDLAISVCATSSVQICGSFSTNVCGCAPNVGVRDRASSLRLLYVVGGQLVADEGQAASITTTRKSGIGRLQQLH